MAAGRSSSGGITAPALRRERRESFLYQPNLCARSGRQWVSRPGMGSELPSSFPAQQCQLPQPPRESSAGCGASLSRVRRRSLCVERLGSVDALDSCPSSPRPRTHRPRRHRAIDHSLDLTILFRKLSKRCEASTTSAVDQEYLGRKGLALTRWPRRFWLRDREQHALVPALLRETTRQTLPQTRRPRGFQTAPLLGLGFREIPKLR